MLAEIYKTALDPLPITPASHPVLYLSGPMSSVGPPTFNYPLFHEVAKRLREQGFIVHNPADNFGGDKSRPYEDCMRMDIRLVTYSDAVALLPGWETSKGANMELTAAGFIGVPAVDAGTLMRVDVERQRRGKLVAINDNCHEVPAALRRVAFAGYARSGKDEAGKALIELGYTKSAFGDIIKRRVKHMGGKDLAEVIEWVTDNEISGDDVLAVIAKGFALVYTGDIDPYTEDNADKNRIRILLERYGETYYDEILTEYLVSLPEKAVNTRLVRCKEAQAWRDAGGIIISVQRPGAGPASHWERDRLNELAAAGHIYKTIINDGSIEDLHRVVREIVGIA